MEKTIRRRSGREISASSLSVFYCWSRKLRHKERKGKPLVLEKVQGQSFDYEVNSLCSLGCHSSFCIIKSTTTQDMHAISSEILISYVLLATSWYKQRHEKDNHRVHWTPGKECIISTNDQNKESCETENERERNCERAFLWWSRHFPRRLCWLYTNADSKIKVLFSFPISFNWFSQEAHDSIEVKDCTAKRLFSFEKDCRVIYFCVLFTCYSINQKFVFTQVV
jgi:hypothetical protein